MDFYPLLQGEHDAGLYGFGAWYETQQQPQQQQPLPPIFRYLPLMCDW